MDTPIHDFVCSYICSDFSRLHVPGHKGSPFLGFEKYDITEIKGADSLFEASGIIARSEANAASLFDTKCTLYSAEGSSLCIKSMLYTAMVNAGNTSCRPVVLAARNVHKSFIYACALLDTDVEWLYPESGSDLNICSCKLDPYALEKRLRSMSVLPFAVYITSPDYLGGICDIPGLSRVCRRHGVPLVVDNAHGAYLKFLPESIHPTDLGASMCCDSAHKTLPVLTGGAYLHISKDAPDCYIGAAKRAMDMFGSTSPSYLILQSLDLCNKNISTGYKDRLADCVGRIDQLKSALTGSGCLIKDTEPLKLVIDARGMGMSGFELAEILREHLVECEYCDFDNVVLMFTPENPEQDYARIRGAMCGLPAGSRATQAAIAVPCRTEKALTIRRAIFSKHETVSPKDSVGRVCGCPTVSCPPAVPIAVSGEIITEEMAALFIRYGITAAQVVCK